MQWTIYNKQVYILLIINCPLLFVYVKSQKESFIPQNASLIRQIRQGLLPEQEGVLRSYPFRR